MTDLNRRQFIAVAAAGCAACCACGEAAFAGEPTAPPPPPGAMDKTPVDIGPKSRYAKDGIIDEFADSKRILVITSEGKIYAPTATCTHKNKAVKLKDGELFCRAHGSRYSVQGTATKGPAKGSLFRYGISVDDKGNIIVDRSKQFTEKQWDDPAASIPVA